jgi:hypothetical protein
VGFTADVLLPTPFFGPYLTLYCLLGVVLREHESPNLGPEIRGSISKQGQVLLLEDRQEQEGRRMEGDEDERQRMLRDDSESGDLNGSEESDH